MSENKKKIAGAPRDKKTSDTKSTPKSKSQKIGPHILRHNPTETADGSVANIFFHGSCSVNGDPSRTSQIAIIIDNQVSLEVNGPNGPGTNVDSIVDAALAQAKRIIETRFEEKKFDDPKFILRFNLSGFSRGACNCLRFANRLKEWMKKNHPELLRSRQVRVNIFALDPVAGLGSKYDDEYEVNRVSSLVDDVHFIQMLGDTRRIFEDNGFGRICLESKLTKETRDYLPLQHSSGELAEYTSDAEAIQTFVVATMLRFFEQHGTHFSQLPYLTFENKETDKTKKLTPAGLERSVSPNGSFPILRKEYKPLPDKELLDLFLQLKAIQQQNEKKLHFGFFDFLSKRRDSYNDWLACKDGRYPFFLNQTEETFFKERWPRIHKQLTKTETKAISDEEHVRLLAEEDDLEKTNPDYYRSLMQYVKKANPRYRHFSCFTYILLKHKSQRRPTKLSFFGRQLKVTKKGSASARRAVYQPAYEYYQIKADRIIN